MNNLDDDEGKDVLILKQEVDGMEPLQKEHGMCSNTQTINKNSVDTRIRVRVKYIL